MFEQAAPRSHLVTGGAGFIGSHLVDALLARGGRVVILDDFSTGREQNIEHLAGSEGVELVRGSVLDEGLVNRLMASVDVCFHLASAVGVQLVIDRPLDSLLRNMRGADIVTEAAASHGTRLIFTSTSEVYGKNSNGPLREGADRLMGSPSKSRWNYATAKALGEMLAFGYGRERGAETIVVRPFNTVGPRQVGHYGMVLPRFVSQALAGEPLTVYGDGTQSRCFTHVHDSVQAFASLAEAELAIGGAYNIGASTRITIHELAELVIARTGSGSEISFVPYEEAYGEGFEELGSRQADASAIEQLCGWRAERAVEEAIDHVAAHMTGAWNGVERRRGERRSMERRGQGVDGWPGPERRRFERRRFDRHDDGDRRRIAWRSAGRRSEMPA